MNNTSIKISLIFLISTSMLFGVVYAPLPPTITLSGNVLATDNFDVSGTISSPTIADLDSRIEIIEGGN